MAYTERYGRRALSFCNAGPICPPAPRSPWHAAHCAWYTALPRERSAPATLAAGAGGDLALPCRLHPPAANAAKSTNVATAIRTDMRGRICQKVHFSPLGKLGGVAATKIYLRFAQQSDAARLLTDNVITGPQPKRETWPQRVAKWLGEQQAGRRVILIAEDRTGLLGMVQLVFSFPPGYQDAEAANGMDVAMMEGLRLRADAPPEVGNQLVSEVQKAAQKRSVKTLTFLLPMNANKALRQAKSWGFEEFRIMPEPDKMLAFFRKSVE